MLHGDTAHIIGDIDGDLCHIPTKRGIEGLGDVTHAVASVDNGLT